MTTALPRPTLLERSEPVKTRCAICWSDPVTKRRGTNTTTRICATCKRDPVNAGWVASPADVPQSERVTLGIDHAIRESIREVIRVEVRAIVREELARLKLPATALPETSDYLSVAQAAKHLHVHPATIRSWIRSGALAGHRAGRHHRVKRGDLEALVNAHRSSPLFDLDVRASEMAAS